MQGNPDMYRDHIAAMDQGIEEEERRRRGLDVEVNKDDARFRWWSGLRKKLKPLSSLSCVELSPL
jgi:hypothetical protein